MVDVKDKFVVFVYVEMMLAVMTSVFLAPYTSQKFMGNMRDNTKSVPPILYGAPFLPVLYRFALVFVEKDKFEKVNEIYLCFVCAIAYILAGILELVEKNDDNIKDNSNVVIIRSIVAIVCGVVLIVDVVLSQLKK